MLVAACGCATQTADAGEARKCVDRDGRNSYVSGPCPPGTREQWLRGFEPDPAPPAAALERIRPERGKASRPRAASASAAHGAKRGKASACDAARRRRDETRDRDWYTLTYDQLSALDARLAKACR